MGTRQEDNIDLDINVDVQLWAGFIWITVGPSSRILWAW